MEFLPSDAKNKLPTSALQSEYLCLCLSVFYKIYLIWECDSVPL